jgi:hypothetical protein
MDKILKRLFKIILIISVAFITSCDTAEPPITPPPPPDLRKITLTFEDAYCTEVWLRIKVDSITLPVELKLMQEATQQNVTLTVKDSVIYIDSLNPNQTYNYQAVLSTDTTIKSEKVTAQTLEPTSHNFTWQTWEFGQHSSSVLYDVAIIDENNIWAVGEIFMNDSLGNPDPTFYNAVHWDGNNWALKRILYQGSIWSIKTIYAFSENDIWFSAFVRYLNGQFIDLPIPAILMGWSINKLWGTSSNDMYVVGNEGNIAHYNGTTWTKIESGTTLNVNDIWGINNSDNNGLVLCAATDLFTNNERKLLRIKNDLSVDTLSWQPNEILMSVWFNSPNKIITAGGGIFFRVNEQWIEQIPLPPYLIKNLRGAGLNDIWAVGGFGVVNWYNGLNWAQIPQLELQGGNYNSVDIKGNRVCIVGYNGTKAVIALSNN